jgi:hypothetical protein
MRTQREASRDSLIGPFLYNFGGNGADWVHPYFLKYEDFGITLTRWLYSDPLGNPSSWDDPSRWHLGPQVSLVKRTLDFVAAASSSSAEQITNIWGGKNAIMVSKMATVKRTTLGAACRILPNEESGLVTFSQMGDDGAQNIQAMPISNVFGTIPGQPETPELPEMWWGNAQKTFVIANTDPTYSYTANLSWTGYVLDSGR